MRLIFLGTGTSQGVPIIGCNCKTCSSDDHRDKRTRTSAIVIAQDTTLLIDASPDLRYQLLNFYNNTKIDAVLITHEHRDHVAGLDDLRPIIFKQKKPMDIFAHERTIQAIKQMFYYSFEPDPYPGAPKFQLHSIDDKPFTINELEIIPIKLWHFNMQIYGFRIYDLAYITDASRIEQTEINKLKGVKTLVVNAIRYKPHYSHFNLQQALDLIQTVRPKQAFLTHLSHIFPPYNEFVAQLPENVKPAYDGLNIEI